MPFGEPSPIPKTEKIKVDYLVNQLKEKVQIELISCAAEDACKKRFVIEAELHRPGLALAGYIDLFTSQRIQIIGNTETEYINHLPKEAQILAFDNIIRFDVPIIFLTDGNMLPDYLLDLAENKHIPIFQTMIETTRFMFIIRDFLDDQFADQAMVHGSMVDVYGVGILISGCSGIGKSEVALDLIERGHRLVADDAVIITKKNNVLMTSATDTNRHFMEIRGLGIVDILSMFGIRAVRYQKRLEVIVELFLWENNEQNIDRTGLDKKTINLLGIEIPHIHLPISPGKNITVIAEVIAMNYLLTHYGYDAAKVFQDRLQSKIAQKISRKGPVRAVDYFETDFE